MRAYIAGPIAGVPDARLRFSTAADYLADLGWDTTNPFDVPAHPHDGECPPTGHGSGEANSEHNSHCHMRADLKAMLDCDAIFMLHGWEYSSGARTEFEAARAAGLTIHYQGQVTRL